MKLTFTLDEITHDYLGDKGIVRLAFKGPSPTPYTNQLFLKVVEAEAKDMTIGQNFVLTPAGGEK